MFEAADRGTAIVASVTLLHARYKEASHLRHAVDPLGQPRRTEAPKPHSAFIEEWSRKQKRFDKRTTIESTVAHLYAFENAKSEKKLEVFVWTLEQVSELEDEDLPALHYAFLLQVSDM